MSTLQLRVREIDSDLVWEREKEITSEREREIEKDWETGKYQVITFQDFYIVNKYSKETWKEITVVLHECNYNIG